MIIATLLNPISTGFRLRGLACWALLLPLVLGFESGDHAKGKELSRTSPAQTVTVASMARTNAQSSILPVAEVSRPERAVQRSVLASYGRLPLSFEANAGQSAAGVKFLSRGHGYTLFLKQTEVVLALQNSTGTHAGGEKSAETLRMALVGGNRKASVEGVEQLSGRTNYFLGRDARHWRTNVPLYARVKYREVYPGVDLVYYGNQSGRLEYDFELAPGADPKAIALRFSGARGIEVDPNSGDLLLKLEHHNDVRFQKPMVYQAADDAQRSPGHRKLVEGRYVLQGHNRVAFRLAHYDAHRPLIIDPALSYSTYLGGSGETIAYGITVDSLGDAYVTGSTLATDFPTTPGAFQRANAGNNDVFITKFNPAGSALIYSTYLGGSAADIPFGIAIDVAGNAYVAGTTNSTDFPITSGAYQPQSGSDGAGPTGFITRLNSTGSALVYSTYLGGSVDDRIFAMALDSAGDVYVSGRTSSPDFPTTPRAYRTRLRGEQNVFITEMDSTGSALVYSTYLGGSVMDQANAITIDTDGDVYVAGQTSSPNFPTTPGAFQTTCGASCKSATNVFVAKFNIPNSVLVYSTFLGGSTAQIAWGIKVDGSGAAYVDGQTTSTDFPATPGAFQTTCGGGCASNSAFVTKLNPNGSGLEYSTFLGGTGEQETFAIALDSAGDAYVCGRSDAPDYPTTPGSFADLGLSYNAVLTEINPSGSALLFSGYLGGDGANNALAITVTSTGNIYLAGRTFSTDFPTTPKAFMPTCSFCNPNNVDGDDAFVLEFAPGAQVWPLTLNFGNQTIGGRGRKLTTTLSNSGHNEMFISGVDIGGTNAADFTQSTTCGAVLSGGSSCTVTVTFRPLAVGKRNAILTIADSAANSPQQVSLIGTGTQ